jgi:hypothetical protein
VSNIYNNNKASNAKIGQNVNKAVYFFANFCRVICISISFDFRMQIIQPGTIAMAPSAHGS